MPVHDLVIRGGTIVDGGGGEPRIGDVAIDGRTIVAIGTIEGRGREEIDATGLIVTPGFVDVHTHYDCQITWDERLMPTSHHGVTTVVMGNCAIGIAPCRPEDHDLLVTVIEGVEDIPEAVLTAGVPWKWETFPEYMDFIEGRHADIDFAAMIAHAPIRVYVMGERAARRELSTQAEQARMTQLVAEAIRCGAVGVSSSRTSAHRTTGGDLAPAETSTEAELMALARGLKDGGGGVFEINIEFADADEGEESADYNLLRRAVKASGGRPAYFLLMEFARQPTLWRTLLELNAQANAEGLPIKGEVMPRANGVLWGLTASHHPFSLNPSYRAIADLPLAAKVAKMRDPAFKAKLLAEAPAHRNPVLVVMAKMFEQAYALGDPADYEQPRERSIGGRAEALGVDPAGLAYDMLLEDEGKAMLYLPSTNYLHANYDCVHEMMTHPDSLVSLGDGGAHYGMICDASYSTYLLTHWVRDRTRGPRVTLPWAIEALTSKPAKAFGFADRGLLAPGMKADLNLIDMERLTLPGPEVVSDLPGGGSRTIQRAKGYVATIVSGEITYREGAPTGALPGRLVRINQQDRVMEKVAELERA
ncbi:N-acyl-D-amino-acid deacylase family protein [Sphingomonas bacterium]|uniref:N-acyl-D-amino-acid deacylase family protein n=1 Tax=Sphingomonas bacterium TaxID=1895847 RepID=UPI0015772573|nr:amidohydrolase family protein [Sphingomonas bacterium]